MNDQNLVVCERTGTWAAAMRRALGLLSGPCETRSWAACLREVQARPAALVALEIAPENAEAACGRVAYVTQRFPRVRVVLLADRNLRPFQWLLREAGAVDILFSLGDLPRLQPILRRFGEQMPSSRLGFRDQVWSRLPWPRRSTDH
ncbi:MAG: hypothetical protein MUE50_04385 [Pirellulaceae bacterium]|nr:hypothetical protein [Pirellulaceae bacterium]MCU0980938.1 hypothetical protein [Pirellulaceae bacterium]